MSLISKLRSFTQTYALQKAGVPEKVVLETAARELMLDFPLGADHPDVSIQPDGSALITEIVQPDAETSDESLVRGKVGDRKTDYLQDQANEALETISRLDIDHRDISESMERNRQEYEALMRESPHYHHAGQVMLLNGLAFLVVALAEITALFVFFADLFGLDANRIGSEIQKHPIAALSTGIFSIGFFFASLLVGDKALYSKHKVIYLICLEFISIAIAKARAAQAAALQDSEATVVFLFLLYAIVGIAFPLSAAVFARNLKEAWSNRELIQSLMRSFEEEDSRLSERLRSVAEERREAQERYEEILDQFSVPYQDEQIRKERFVNDWELHRRRMEARLSELRLAYRFWEGWRTKGLAVPEDLKRYVGIGVAVLFALIFSLLLLGRDTAHADDSFNLLALCDRSSSAGEYSCTPKTIDEAARIWIDKAGDAGSGTFELFLIDKGFDSTVVLFLETYPDKFSGPVSAHKKKWKKDFLERLGAATKDLPVNRGSAISEAIYRISLRTPNKGRTLIYLMSDMREVTEAFNFERKVPAEREFLHWLRVKAIWPKFNTSTELIACGLHPYSPDSTSRMTTRNYDQLIKLWNRVFTNWGLKASLNEACGLGNQYVGG